MNVNNKRNYYRVFFSASMQEIVCSSPQFVPAITVATGECLS